MGNSPSVRGIARIVVVVFLGGIFLFLFASRGWAGEKWWKTGRVEGFSTDRYMTALGYGSTLDRARKNALQSLSQQIDSSIRSRYRQESTRSGMSATRSSNNSLTVHSHARLYGIKDIRGRWVASEGTFVAVVGVRRNDLVRYLRGRISNYRSSIGSLESDLSSTQNPMRQIKDLGRIIRAKERAAFLDREMAVVDRGTPSSEFNVESDIARIETLLSRHMTVSVSLRNDCGKIDRFVRDVEGSIEKEVTGMGLLVVPSGGQVLISGSVGARPMPKEFSRRYRYYILHYALSMASPDGTVWGAVAREQKVAGITPGQAELLAVGNVRDGGVHPLLEGLRSKLFLGPDDPEYSAFPGEGKRGAAAPPAPAPVGRNCDDFGSRDPVSSMTKIFPSVRTPASEGPFGETGTGSGSPVQTGLREGEGKKSVPFDITVR